MIRVENHITGWLVGEHIVPYYRKNQLSTLTSNTKTNTPISLSSVEATPPPTTNMLVAPPSPNKSVESTVKKASKPLIMKKSYVQASKPNILCKVKDILWVKEVFLALLADKVEKVLKIKNSCEGNKKPRINMTTREPLRREVIISMTKVYAELIVNSAHIHISNINKCLKNSKSDTFADFIWFNANGITITINKPASNLDLSTIEKYLKNIKNINLISLKVF